MKAILIDPVEQTIEMVDRDFADFREIQRTIECSAFTTAGYIGTDCVYCDDEGLLKPNLMFTLMDHYPQPLAGKIVILGTDDEGDSTDVSLTEDEIALQVKFLTIFDVKRMYA